MHIGSRGIAAVRVTFTLAIGLAGLALSGSPAPADDAIGYLQSTSNPAVFREHTLSNGLGGTVELALVRSFWDPNANPPADYTGLVQPGAPYALDTAKVQVSNVWYRLMSDCGSRPGGAADGCEDGIGDAASLYDQGMAVISLVGAGQTNSARKILDAFKHTVFAMLDSDATAERHPLGPVKDQGEYLDAFPSVLLGASFDVWRENSTPQDEAFQAHEDRRLPAYPRLAPGHEYGIWMNDPVSPTWTGVDDAVDSPRVSEITDRNDADDLAAPPYYENGHYHRFLAPYALFVQWANCDEPVTAGTEGAQKLDPDRILPYSELWPRREWSIKDYTAAVGDNLWLVIAVLHYTHETGDAQYLPVAYRLMDTMADNLQDFNGGIHFGYYGAHEITATATEHCLDFAFAWHWIDKLYDGGNGPVDPEHWLRYKRVMDGTVNLTPGAIAVLDITGGANGGDDDRAVDGADLMLRFLAIPHTVHHVAADAATLDLPAECRVLICPETPYRHLDAALRQAIRAFAEAGGCIFGAGNAAVGAGQTDNPFGVEFAETREIGGTTGGRHPIRHAGRNMVISKLYKDGIDNPSSSLDWNFNGIPDPEETDTEPSEIDNWEEGAGNLWFAYTAMAPYDHILLWSYPDYKRSRLTYFLADIGDGPHALNGGHTPNPLAGEDRTANEGNSLTVKQLAWGPTVYTANEWGHLCMMRAKVDFLGTAGPGDPYTYTDELETLYFNEPGDGTHTGRVVYFVGNMFSFFSDCMRHRAVDGVTFSPYKGACFNAFWSHAQLLENALQWFFTPELEPAYTVRDPYGTHVVYSEHQAGEMGHYCPIHGRFGTGVTSVDLDWQTEPLAGNKCIRVERTGTSDSTGGFWLTKSIDFGSNVCMTAGLHEGGYVGSLLPGVTNLAFWARAEQPCRAEFGFGILDESGERDKQDSAHAGLEADIGTNWTQICLATHTNNMSCINGVFYASLRGNTTLYIDEIRYQPAVYGYNNTDPRDRRVIYREGRNTEGIWSGFMGEHNGAELSIDRHCTNNPHSGEYCLRIDLGYYESWAGVWVQALAYDPSLNPWPSAGSTLKGADLTGATRLTFWARADSTWNGYEFGYGYADAADPDSSCKRLWPDYWDDWTGSVPPPISTNWQKYEIDLTGRDLGDIKGLFLVSIAGSPATIYLDDVVFEPVGNGPVPTYQEDVDAGNCSPYLWRNKNLAHLGLTHYLENAVWADSDDYLRLPIGCWEPSTDNDGDGLPDDIYYEMDQLLAGTNAARWPPPSEWARRKMFIRGQLDWVKVADMCTWGAVYWLDKPGATCADTSNALDLVQMAEDVFMTDVAAYSNGVCVKQVRSMEYWDMADNDLENVGDDFGESVWPEGIGQLIHTACLAGRYDIATNHIAQMEQVVYAFGEGKAGYPYAWPCNMITDIAGPGWGDDQERTDSLSIAATTWMHLGRNVVNCYANARIGKHAFVVESPCGSPVPGPGTHWYPHGMPLQCTVPDAALSRGATQLVCVGWAGTGSVPWPETETNGTAVFELTSDSSIAWTWGTNYWLDVETEFSGTVSVADGWYRSGSNVAAVADPAPFFHFEQWSGGATGTGCAAAVCMDAPKSIVAWFTSDFVTNDALRAWLLDHGLGTNHADAVADSDHDHMANWAEYIAGTAPTNEADLLEIRDPARMEADTIRLAWPSVAGRVYGIEQCTNLASDAWVPVCTNLLAEPPANTVVLPLVPCDEPAFYRIVVERP
ncbi:MAG: hypothetical protein JXR37_04510 [Kiritimatiellae bacterium]|nr:hypothetical protein [Kiritimatiellia bacterium]